MESANQEIDGHTLGPLNEESHAKYKLGFGELMPEAHIQLTLQKPLGSNHVIYRLDLTKNWIEDNLEIYKVWIT